MTDERILAKTWLGREYPEPFGKNQKGPTDGDIGVMAALDAVPECRTKQAGMKYFAFPLLDPV